jgi:hypothetical protein
VIGNFAGGAEGQGSNGICCRDLSRRMPEYNVWEDVESSQQFDQGYLERGA